MTLPYLSTANKLGLMNLYRHYYPFIESIKLAMPDIDFYIHGGQIRDLIRGKEPGGDIDLIIEPDKVKVERFYRYLVKDIGCSVVNSEALYKANDIKYFKFGGRQIIEVSSQDKFFHDCREGDFTINSFRLSRDYKFYYYYSALSDIDNRRLVPIQNLTIERLRKSYSFESDGFKMKGREDYIEEHLREFDLREVFGEEDVQISYYTWSDNPDNTWFNVCTLPQGIVTKIDICIGDKKIDMYKWAQGLNNDDLWHCRVEPDFIWDNLDIHIFGDNIIKWY